MTGLCHSGRLIREPHRGRAWPPTTHKPLTSTGSFSSHPPWVLAWRCFRPVCSPELCHRAPQSRWLQTTGTHSVSGRCEVCDPGVSRTCSPGRLQEDFFLGSCSFSCLGTSLGLNTHPASTWPSPLCGPLGHYPAPNWWHPQRACFLTKSHFELLEGCSVRGTQLNRGHRATAPLRVPSPPRPADVTCSPIRTSSEQVCHW